MSEDSKEDPKKIEKVMYETLRSTGHSVPKKDGELEETFDNLTPIPLSEDFIKRVSKQVIEMASQSSMEIKAETIEGLKKAEAGSSETSEIHPSFLAAARNQGKLPLEIREKLDADRRKLDELAKKKKLDQES